MSNTGQVPMNYNLRLAPGSGIPEDEFLITPSSGVIPPMSAESILVDFLANRPGEYDTALLVDIEDVGEAVDSLPVKAACLVPTLKLATNHVSYGSCFIRNEYTMNIEVCNDTALTGKFELALVDRGSVEGVVGVHIGNTDEGTSIEIIEPRTTVQVPVTLTLLAVGEHSFSLCMRSLGSTATRPTILLTAVGCGPIVEVQPPLIAFGQAAVLQEAERALALRNTSPIEARYTVSVARAALLSPGAVDGDMDGTSNSTKKARGDVTTSVFRVEPEGGVIEPFGETSLRIFARPDEACPFTSDLVVTIQYSEGSLAPVPLKVTGVGFALVPEESMEDIQFGDVFTDTRIFKNITVHNKGRRDQELQWQNVRGAKVKEGAPPITFTIRPERTIIPPRGNVVFTVEGFTNTVGVLSDSFALKQCGTFKEVLRSKVTANFVDPLLQYSARSLAFQYVEPYTGEGGVAPPNVTLQSLRMKNVTSKELQIVLKIQSSRSPFSLEGPLERTIASGETVVVGVKFNPAYSSESVSHHVKHSLLVTFVNHSHTDTLTLSAHLVFPELTVAAPGGVIDFGAIIKDTEAHRSFSLVNPSKELPAVFEWKMLTDAPEAGEGPAEPDAVKRFDLVPFKGVIQPGGTQEMEATFYGAVGKSERTAVCQVKGGPRTPAPGRRRR
ncbi:hypothetical protein STCU_06275 [Strigomonas culicis]|uniref:MSP domain-containing protein n=1 Tax=Strigomonas culicis TaxID=28005 RepID=S9U5Y9_9TRYP|nr:hypothetical protein STCU_06275 [Strigomonas culicis]|eukprot:EPY26192.1 hypothetical protein STCU_06275 [Strigomonas culicis]